MANSQLSFAPRLNIAVGSLDVLGANSTQSLAASFVWSATGANVNATIHIQKIGSNVTISFPDLLQVNASGILLLPPGLIPDEFLPQVVQSFSVSGIDAGSLGPVRFTVHPVGDPDNLEIRQATGSTFGVSGLEQGAYAGSVTYSLLTA